MPQDVKLPTLLQNAEVKVDYHNPYFPTVGKGLKYKLNMTCASLDDIA